MGNGIPFLSCEGDPPKNDNTKVTLGLARSRNVPAILFAAVDLYLILVSIVRARAGGSHKKWLKYGTPTR